MLTKNNNYNIINGNIITLNNIVPIANSITVSNGCIESINSPNNKYKSIDLEGLTILPGLVDSHFHLSNFGKRLEMINLKKLKSVSEIVERVDQKIQELGPKIFIHGFGWDQTRWDDQKYPDKDVLNYFEYNPVILTRIDGHSMWANQAAIQLSTYKDDVIAPNGGEIINGCIFIDNAMDPIRNIIPKSSKNDTKRWIMNACNKAKEYGIIDEVMQNRKLKAL